MVKARNIQTRSLYHLNARLISVKQGSMNTPRSFFNKPVTVYSRRTVKRKL